MKIGRYYLSTGFIRTAEGTRHLLVALHRNWRFSFVRPAAKPDYRRLYVGPLEIEWSRTALSASQSTSRAALAKSPSSDRAASEVVEQLTNALTKLEREASEVSKIGAKPGTQWTRLAGALINARAVLAEAKGSGQ